MAGGGDGVCGYREAMTLTGLKKTKLYDLFRRGVVRGYRDGRMVRFYRASLVRYMEDRENPPAAPAVAPAAARTRKPPKPPGVRFKFL
ncbi:MAG: helix-turn-helix domain-containing protein [Gemmataceae bacterium]|nr:helix-turn-helix domain-containing protein [Gemmataceae bacterium]